MEKCTVILVFVTPNDIDDFEVISEERSTPEIINDTVDALYDEYAGTYDRIEVVTKGEECIVTQTYYGECIADDKIDSDPFDREEIYNEDVYDDDEIDKDPNLERGWKNRE